jgi:hypothetical protein
MRFKIASARIDLAELPVLSWEGLFNIHDSNSLLGVDSTQIVQFYCVMSKNDEADYLAMAEEADKAALRASSRVAKKFLAAAAQEYRKRAAEQLRQQQMTKGD